eukprot:GHUV01039110.1.p1 GENE.GHUV01039110.1~~GHUV01039110.1.p1  ORF type:complete len:139 (-),score=23.45 GHUV01039110.1:823-1239(-)
MLLWTQSCCKLLGDCDKTVNAATPDAAWCAAPLQLTPAVLVPHPTAAGAMQQHCLMCRAAARSFALQLVVVMKTERMRILAPSRTFSKTFCTKLCTSGPTGCRATEGSVQHTVMGWMDASSAVTTADAVLAMCLSAAC